MAKKDWDVRTNLNAKPGAQGTLFSGGSKFMSDRRYPKGYTPERQAEVADAVVEPSVQNFLNKPKETSTGTQSKNFKDRRVTVGLNPDYPEGYRMDSRQETRRLVDNVARSTVPLSHLSGVQFRTNHGDQMLGNNVAGHYDRRGDAMTHGDPVIRIREGAAATSTTIHEIGHHVSHTVAQNTHPYDAAGHSGQEEAFADNYAEQHFRDRARKPVERGTYGGGQFAGHIQRTDEFWKSYHGNRDNSMYKNYVDTENEVHYQQYPEDRVHTDGSQDVPLVEKSFVTREDRKRGVRPDIDVNWEAKP